MEEFLPGLFKVMEGRLGPLGRPITTLLVLAIVIGIFVWVGDLVYSKAILPLTTVVGEPWPYIRGIVVGYGLGLILLLGAFAALDRWLSRRLKHKREELQEHIDTHVEEDLPMHEAIALYKECIDEVKELNRLLEHAGLDKRVRIPGTIRQPTSDK